MSFWFLEHTDLTVEQQTDALKAVIAGIRESALWIALALALILIVTGIIINVKFHDKFRAFITLAVATTLGFAIALIGVLLYLQISRLVLKDEINLNFWLWVGFAALLVISVVTCAVLKIFKTKAFKYVAWIAFALNVAFVIVILCRYPTEDGFAPINGNNALYIILSVALTLAIAVATILCDKTKPEANNTKALTYAGICVAISYALSYIKFFDGPQGSSVTLVSMLPIMLYAYIFGAKRGIIAGLVYGVLQCIQDPQIYEPLQVMLDYPIAFCALGLAGIFKNKKFLKGNKILEFALGIIVAGVARYLAHVLSGYFVFYTYAAWSDISNPLLYSIVYNSAVLIDAALDVVAGIFLLSSKTMTKQIELINPDGVIAD